jgi:superfamily II DNA or RNA helicase
MELRDYQQEALGRVRGAIAKGARRVALVAPTGSGKTVLAAHMIEAVGESVLFLAHRKELVDQASAKLSALGVRHGILMAGRRWVDAPVQVASVQSLSKRWVPRVSYVVVDECHHTPADSFLRIVRAVPRATVLGLTATPWRLDGRGLADLFDTSVLVATPADLVARGFLVPALGFTYDRPAFSGVGMRAGDYDEAAAGEVMRARVLLDRVVERWLRYANGLRTVVFACTVAHSRDLVQSFVAAGVKAEHLDGKTPKVEREALLARLRTGETTVVSNVGVLTEGWDEPSLGCVILARPTKSVGLYLQMVGRGRRPFPGKKALRLHDHTGCVLEHGEVDDERDWSLDKGLLSRNAREARLSTCPSCAATYSPRRGRCPACDGDGASKGAVPIRYVDGAERALLAPALGRPANWKPPVRLPIAEKMGGAANKRGGKQVWLRLSAEQLDLIDEIARGRALERGARQIDRGEVVREALDAWMAERAQGAQGEVG